MTYRGKWNRKLPKLRKGAWFVRVRGSYLPMTPEGWFLHLLLLMSSVAIIASSYNDNRDVVTAIISMLLELIGLGTIFTYLASKKA